MKKISFEDALILSAIRTARFFVQFLPLRTSLGFGAFVGELAYFFSKRKPVMRRNLRAVFAAEKSPQELNFIARESFRNLGRMAIELLRAPELGRSYVEKHVQFLGRPKIEEALAKGNGALFLTAHFGNWEMLSLISGLIGFPVTALAREQKHPRSNAYLNDLRRSTGNQVIYKGMPIREILRALKQGRIVGILSDQDGGKTGAFVRFFNRLSSYPKGVASFALRTGAPILPAFIFRDQVLNHRIEIEGPLKVPDENLSEDEREKQILEQFASLLETKIRKDPTQWLWAHRRWKSTPDRFILILSDGKAGHRNQSLALFDAIERERLATNNLPGTTHLKTIEVKFKNDFSRKIHALLYRIFCGRLPFERLWAKYFLTPDSYREIMSTYADVVISTGSSMAGLNLWAGKENAARSVVVMDPGFGVGRFFAVIAPFHDRLKKGPSIFQVAGALTRTTQERLDGQAQELRACLPMDSKAPVLGLLLGGDTPKIGFERQMLETILTQISSASQGGRYSLLATTSRRTPLWADEVIKQKMGSLAECRLLVVANQANRPGIVEGILGLADAVIVSGESISMVSEAVASRKKVWVIEPYDRTKLKPKQERFLNQMQADGFLARVSPERLRDVLASPQNLFHGKSDLIKPALSGENALQEAVRMICR